ncbi:uncharacterized protein LOC133525164 [Cydia pomonella]|uniref:uncharacterized protein LOC133525164 n=1 Tax=Cydia pomonella TaxID=82600 RepID=UPI002ADD857E|nr:uncharacterized protein LOC133525164 [Cydia pomonella]
MLCRLAICGVIFCVLSIPGILGQLILGTGRWSVQNVQDCENDEKYPATMHVRRFKLNRTHDAFNVDTYFGVDVDESFGIRIVIYKKVDGGFKLYMTLADNNLPRFVKAHSEKNIKYGLELAGLDPPDFPVPKGELHIKNFVINMDELAQEGMYGEFMGYGYIIKDLRDVACMKVYYKYEPADDKEPLVGRWYKKN